MILIKCTYVKKPFKIAIKAFQNSNQKHLYNNFKIKISVYSSDKKLSRFECIKYLRR